MKITFKNNSVLEVETFGTDIHDNLIIELKTEEYTDAKNIIFNPECTSEITDGEKTYLDYTNVKAFGSGVDNDGNTRIKVILTYGKDVSATISELKSQIETLKNENSTLTETVTDLSERNSTLELSQSEQDEVLDILLTSDEGESNQTK